MARTFKPLSLEGIDEGRFLAQVEGDLRKAQASLVEFVKKHGPESKGAKAKLTVEITLGCVNPTDMLFGIKASTKTAVPNRPPSVSLALSDEDDDGTPALFARSSGTSRAIPQQGVLTTEDGRVVDQKTGEVKGAAPAP
jgi:hypothetical protein